MPATTTSWFLPVRDYDLAATLTSGQAFRWTECGAAWEGVIGSRWVRLRGDTDGIAVETTDTSADRRWLVDYLQTDADYAAVLRSFPNDEPMRASVAACRGLRLLRQDPWECLASFLMSSTKQIVQIRQIIALLCERFGEPVPVPPGHAPARAFPTAERLAAATEAELRACKMGFRAPSLLATAHRVATRQIVLDDLRQMPLTAAREEVAALPGCGRKNRQLRPALRLRISRSVPRGRVGAEGAAGTLFSTPPAERGAAGEIRRKLFRSQRGLRAAVLVSLHADRAPDVKRHVNPSQCPRDNDRSR